MSTLYIVVGIMAGSVSFLTGIYHGARWLGRTIQAVAAFRAAVEDNTIATSVLSETLATHSASVTARLDSHDKRLDDHDRRITQLETPDHP